MKGWVRRIWIMAPRSASSEPGWRRLCGPFAIGYLALAAILCVPSKTYLNLPDSDTVAADEADAATTSEPAVEKPLRRGIVPIPVLSFEQKGSVAEDADAKQVKEVRTRVAANILRSSGYLTHLRIVPTRELDRPGAVGTFRSEVTDCLGKDSDARRETVKRLRSLGEKDLHKLTVGVVAVEKFNRTAFHRRLEWFVATGVLSARGHLIDLSLGPAQLRPSTVRRLAARNDIASDLLKDITGSDGALLEALMDECKALRIAAAVLVMNACDQCKDPSQQAVQLYAGQRRRTDATIDYYPIVLTISQILQ